LEKGNENTKCKKLKADPKVSERRKLNFAKNVTVESSTAERFCFLCQEAVVEAVALCVMCRKWAHEKSVGQDTKKGDYVCDFCCIYDY
jgi:hypothetical protein